MTAGASDITIITGGSGWLGRALLSAFSGRGDPRFERRGAIRALVHTPSDVAEVVDISDRIAVHVGDVTDRDALRRLFKNADGASVIHTAGVIHPRKVSEFMVNIEGTRAVAEAASTAAVGRFVHVSSNSPFGVNATPADVFHAQEPYRPYLGYGRSKMEAEVVIRAAVEAGALDAVVVRPPWFYGPFQPARQTSFFRLVRRGVFPLFGDGTHRRSMVYIDNLVSGIACAERTPGVSGKAYWIADERAYPMTEIVATVKLALADAGLPVADRQVRVPRVAGSVAQRLDGALQRRGRYHQELHVLGELHETIACDISAARADLGYLPEVDLAEGMRRSVRWCLERGVAL
jgi:nucleoside-diphosphate-sugar epimerase